MWCPRFRQTRCTFTQHYTTLMALSSLFVPSHWVKYNNTHFTTVHSRHHFRHVLAAVEASHVQHLKMLSLLIAPTGQMSSLADPFEMAHLLRMTITPSVKSRKKLFQASHKAFGKYLFVLAHYPDNVALVTLQRINYLCITCWFQNWPSTPCLTTKNCICLSNVVPLKTQIHTVFSLANISCAENTAKDAKKPGKKKIT